jgi:hypothetical protein
MRYQAKTNGRKVPVGTEFVFKKKGVNENSPKEME